MDDVGGGAEDDGEGRESTLETLRSRGRCETGVILTVVAIAAVSYMMADEDVGMWGILGTGVARCFCIVLGMFQEQRQDETPEGGL